MELGDKVIFSNPTSGYDYDQRLARKYLQENEEYTLNTIEVENWVTYVTFTEIPGVKFNSVLFKKLSGTRQKTVRYD